MVKKSFTISAGWMLKGIPGMESQARLPPMSAPRGVRRSRIKTVHPATTQRHLSTRSWMLNWETTKYRTMPMHMAMACLMGMEWYSAFQRVAE